MCCTVLNFSDSSRYAHFVFNSFDTDHNGSLTFEVCLLFLCMFVCMYFFFFSYVDVKFCFVVIESLSGFSFARAGINPTGIERSCRLVGDLESAKEDNPLVSWILSPLTCELFAGTSRAKKGNRRKLIPE